MSKEVETDMIAQHDIPAPSKLTPWQTFLAYIWDTDQHLKSPFERHLLRKLDLGILSVCCLGFFMRYLDASNLANAYVSGMKEDLDIQGNEYTYMGTCYTVAYALFQIPGTLMVTRVRPTIFLFCCELGWGIFTFAQACAQTSQQMYAFRFCVGMFESAFFPSLLYLMGSWYSKTELNKRLAIFHLSGSLGSAFGGYLQAAVYKTLDGHHGIAGWRWLYIVCGCMTSQPGERKIDRQLLKRMFSSWKWYGFVLGYVVYGTSCQASSYFGIWLKSVNYSVESRNIIPSCGSLLSALCIFLWGLGSDLTGSRFAFVFGPLAYGLLPNGILAAWPASNPLKFFAFFTGGCQLMTAVFYTWANEIMAGDNELRAITIASMNGIQYSVSAWLPIIIFPQTMAPSFRRGFPTTFALVALGLIIIVGIKFMTVRDERRGLINSNQDVAEGPSSGSNEDIDEKYDLKDGQTTTTVQEVRK
ncbi:pantothenate transporter liz1 [Mrakia frigida]|uniref:pantothenate transporter liz1 n=1 Tax=Mrakia frigida TaxID=29902 RepID=UPI003FCC07D2